MKHPYKITLTDEQLKTAREWLAECTWPDAEPEDFADSRLVQDAQVQRGIARFFSGGIAGFIADCGPWKMGDCP